MCIFPFLTLFSSLGKNELIPLAKGVDGAISSEFAQQGNEED